MDSQNVALLFILAAELVYLAWEPASGFRMWAFG